MEKLYNGIVLPDEWPPGNINIEDANTMAVPYLSSRPRVINVDCGRQLFVDDFLIESTNMTRVFHRPAKYPGNPVLFPQGNEEKNPDYPPCSAAKCGGVWHDGKDGLFKMWYMAGYAGAMAYAESHDGIGWNRPELDVVPGTNLCLPRKIHPDSGTVWIDYHATVNKERFKMLLREPNSRAKKRGIQNGSAPGLIMTSADGKRWSKPELTGPMGDRSTMFYNPFRKKWVHSIRSSCKLGRSRHYFESDNFRESAEWKKDEPVPWAAADFMDESGDCLPQLYTLDAVAYESIMLGFFQIFKGPPNPVCALTASPKLTEITVGYSRDGFHWVRPERKPFIGANRVAGSWEYGYVEPSGGVCLVVKDELWFYYTAYAGDPSRADKKGIENGMYGNGAVGLAKLRKDGFVSMESRFKGAYLMTTLISFKGKKLFVNASMSGGKLRVGFTDRDGNFIPGFSPEDCIPFTGNSVCNEIKWKNGRSLARLKETPVRAFFTMERGQIFSFWITDSEKGRSGGYTGAGGPGFKSDRDV